MLEILGIILLCNKNKANATARGRNPGGFVALTVCLWIGFEILGGAIGGAAELGIGAYAIAIVFALIGGLISYFVAKNCKPGDYVPEDKTMTNRIAQNAEPLAVPAQLVIVRESSMVGAIVSWTFLLNGKDIGSLGNGKSMTATTGQKQNILVGRDAYGNEIPPLIFDVQNGGAAEIHFKAGKFLPMQSRGVLPASQPVFNGVPAVAAATAQAAFCHNCGEALENEAVFCTNCGAKRFAGQPETQGSGGGFAQPFPHQAFGSPQNSVIMEKPMFAVWTAATLTGAWLLIFLLHCFIKMQLSFQYCSNVSFLLVGALLATGVYLLLQKNMKNKLFGAGALAVHTILSAWTTVTVQMSSSMRISIAPLFTAPQVYRVFLPHAFLRTVIIAGAALLIFWLTKIPDEKRRITHTGLFTACAVFVYDIAVFAIRTRGFASVPPVNTVSMVFGNIMEAVTLALGIYVLYKLCRLDDRRIRLSGWGLIWCWLCTVGMCLSFFLMIGGAFGLEINAFSSQLVFSAIALTGFILLISGRRIGLYLITIGAYITLAGQFEYSLNMLMHGVDRYTPLLLGAVFGAANPIITWFSIRRSWNGAAFIARERANIECPGKPFDKFAAIFNLCAWFLIAVFPFYFVVFEGYFDPTMLICIVPGILFTAFSISILLRLKRNFPKWMRITGIVLFAIGSIVALLILIGIVSSL